MELKSNKYVCDICNKQYTKKTSFDKHKLVCEFKIKSKRELEIEVEESSDIPTYNQLVQIVQEMSLKIIKMEEKIEKMQKYITIKNRKTNILLWLNKNLIANIGFLEWVHSYLFVKAEHFENLMKNDNTIYNILQYILQDNLSEQKDFIYPLVCLSQKNGVFYICDKKENGDMEWQQMTLNDMVLILKLVQNKMIREITIWKEENNKKFDDDAKLAISFNKAVIKLMDINLSQESIINKIKNGLYNCLKKDLNI